MLQSSVLPDRGSPEMKWIVFTSAERRVSHKINAVPAFIIRYATDDGFQSIQHHVANDRTNDTPLRDTLSGWKHFSSLDKTTA